MMPDTVKSPLFGRGPMIMDEIGKCRDLFMERKRNGIGRPAGAAGHQKL